MYSKNRRVILAFAFIGILLSYALNSEANSSLQCYDCHGTRETRDIRPEDASFRNPSSGGIQGNHRNHVGYGATSNSCQKCHPGSTSYVSGHRDGKINLSGNINSSVHPAKARYVNSSSSAYNNYTSFPQAANKTGRYSLGSCSNVNCHFENLSPEWGSAALVSPVDCTKCHGIPPSGGTTGAAGSHARHDVYYSGVNQCIKCHVSHTADLNPFSHATSTGKRNLIVAPKDPQNTPDGSYNGLVDDYLPSQNNTFGSCSSLYCHSNAAPFDKANVTATPTWGATLTCSSCHDGGGDSSGLSGRHPKHTGGTYNFTCDRCHNATATGSFTIKSTAKHVNKYKDVSFKQVKAGDTYNDGTKSCGNTYCHSDGAGGAPREIVKWSDTAVSMNCYSCHKGRTTDSTRGNCDAILGHWTSGYCTPDLTMSSNGHHRLVGPQWVRKYPCYYCHAATVDNNNTLNNISSMAKHLNGKPDIKMAKKWAMGNRSTPSYNPVTKVCNNVYCHSDGTTDPEDVRAAAWNGSKLECNACHGHPTGKCSTRGCHDGKVHDGDSTNKLWTLPSIYGNLTSVFKNHTGYHWPVGQEWKGALPMFPNQGPGTSRANSHPRHLQTNFTCDKCHADTVVSGSCTSCHRGDVPAGNMSEVSHINAEFHVDTLKTVKFSADVGGEYDQYGTKKCTNTACHTSLETPPVWGGSVDVTVTCFSCHGATGSGTDVNDYNAFNGVRGKINMTEWKLSGHGRYSSAINPQTGQPYGSYKSGNPAANFPSTDGSNPCWYCHDNNVIHSDPTDPYRLKMHVQYERRFEKECVYCHMVRSNVECLSCHVGQTESISPQTTTVGIKYKYKFRNLSTRIEHGSLDPQPHLYVANCLNNGVPGNMSCHPDDSKTHKVNAGIWTSDMKADVKNQYMMMGVCLQCHDDDRGGQCDSCHIAPDSNPNKYSRGYDPGSGKITPKKARASAGHFGYKHYRDFTNSGGWLKHYTSVKSPIFGTYSVVNGTWKGGKFCWDCHDPHGDSNIYMIQKRIATTTDGVFGIPRTFSEVDVVFTNNKIGSDYAVKSEAGAIFNGVCNVCHAPPPDGNRHFTYRSGDGHNIGRRCTDCHQHRFSDSHAGGRSCSNVECHTSSKPIPKHTAFGLPRDCTKCHASPVGKRVNVMGQLNANSHHIQGIEANNKHCYACHWESTPEGLINVNYHAGYNYKNYSTSKNSVVDLVLWGAGVRPTVYNGTTAVTFQATVMGSDSTAQRTDVAKISNHCLSCHSDQNNNTDPFGDCKTPRQYAWDLQSVASRYLQGGTTSWGKYSTSIKTYPLAETNKKKKVTKAFSAHGNASNNAGGFSNRTGIDGTITNSRAGAGVTNPNVQCYDCHNSHGSMVVGTTSSYTTFNGTNNGANLKETKSGVGGYTNTYYAVPNSAGVNPYAEGAGQCFDCHNNRDAASNVDSGKTPWGYKTTFGATAPIMGYKDTAKFATPGGSIGVKASTARFPWRDSRKVIQGGHLMASTPGSSLPHLAKASGSATGGSNSTLTDSFKNWSTSATIKTETTISTGGALSNPYVVVSQNSRKPASGVWSPGGGVTINRIHIVNQSQRMTDFFTVRNQAGTQLWRGSGVVDGWVDITPAATGIYTEFTSDAGTQDGVGGDVPEVISTTSAIVSWPAYSKWADFYLLMTGGDNNGLIRKITGNTSNTLTFDPFDATVKNGDDYRIVPYASTVGGLCTPCHDPHGVSTKIPNRDYAVPLLKGTWMTSPYKEDQPPPFPTGAHINDVYTGGGKFNNKERSWGNRNASNPSSNYPTPIEPVTRHNIDRNTFGGSKRISEKDDKFAGLCMNCHPKPRLTDNVKKNDGSAGFKTVDRIHESVKGWGVNSEHSFTCSKCHQTHNSGLPRLMQTDCLDYDHRGGISSGGQPYAADKTEPSWSAHSNPGGNPEHRGFPIGSILGTHGGNFEATTACHAARFAPDYSNGTQPAQWLDGSRWNNVTPWSSP